MQYYANPIEMVAASKERHTQMLREAEMYRRMKAMAPVRQPFSTRLVTRLQRLAQAGRQHWLRTRTIFKLAPVE